MSTIGRGGQVGDLVPPLMVIGIGSGMTIPLSPIALAAAAAAGSGSGSASTLVTAAREMAGVLGIAVTGAVIAARSDVLVAAGASARTGFLDGYRLGLLTAAALTLAGALIAGVLLRDRDRSAS